MVWYIETLSIPELTALFGIGEVLIRLSIYNYTENETVELKEIEQLEYAYLATTVATIVMVETWCFSHTPISSSLRLKRRQLRPKPMQMPQKSPLRVIQALL